MAFLRLQSSTAEETSVTTAIAIDKDKNSQHAVKWAVDNLLTNNSSQCILIHVRSQSLHPQDFDAAPKEGRPPTEAELQQFFLPYRGFCARKGIEAKEVILHDIDIPNALVDYILNNYIGNIVVGASSRNLLLRRLKNADVPTCLLKSAPESCAVYAISKGKVQSSRLANRPQTSANNATMTKQRSLMGFLSFSKRVMDSPKIKELNVKELKRNPSHQSSRSESTDRTSFDVIVDSFKVSESDMFKLNDDIVSPPIISPPNRSPFIISPSFISPQIRSPSFISPQIRSPSTISAKIRSPSIRSPSIRSLSIKSPSIGSQTSESFDINSISGSSDISGPPSFLSTDIYVENLDMVSESSGSFTSHSPRCREAEIRRLRHELKQSMEMYNSVCQEAYVAIERARVLQEWKTVEERKLEEFRLAEEAALALAEAERQKKKAAVEAAEMAQLLAELEAQKTKIAEMKALREAAETKRALNRLAYNKAMYRRYTIQEIETATNHFAVSNKIGEGAYGPVFKAMLHHTAVAIKVLRPDLSQGQRQFQQEVEILSRMRHPHMVILLGACPEYGCLVYEYMENGSLEDRLFRKGNTPPIPWKTRFRISAEIGTCLHFLHQAKPEPLVHRDLKPANILLDGNYVSKISDVGLARLVPPSIADSVTQYRLTAAVGTFCYIDPEYQQTGLLGVKSDLYSFGILLLQIITAKSPVGLTVQVQEAIEKGLFEQMLDPTVPDWPVEEALSLAKIALRCSEMRKKDRPDLGLVVLPELNRLRELGSKSVATEKIVCESRLYSSVPNMGRHANQIYMRSGWQRLKYGTRVWNMTIASASASRKGSSLPLSMKQEREPNEKTGVKCCWSFVNCSGRFKSVS